MRTQVGCAALVAVGLLMADHVIARNSLPFDAARHATAPTVQVIRAYKSDRLPLANSERATRKIAAVEVVGIDQAAVIYRDRDGRELFRTDPLENATIVVRGLSLPALTFRNGDASPVQPLVIDAQKPIPTLAPQPSSSKKPPQPAAAKPKLLDGCEPSMSPLAGATSGLHARCIAMSEPSTRLASLY